MIGIYKIENKESKNVYIGQSKNIEFRWISHKMELIKNIHHNFYLQKEFNEFVEIIKEEHKNNSLIKYLNIREMAIDIYYNFEVIEEFKEYNINQLLEIEDTYILKYRNIKEGYKQHTNKEIKEYNDKKEEKKRIEAENAKIYWNNRNMLECKDKEFGFTYGNDNFNIEYNTMCNSMDYTLGYLIEKKGLLNNDYIALSLSDIINFTPYNRMSAEGFKNNLKALKRMKIIQIDTPINKITKDKNIIISIVRDNLSHRFKILIDTFKYKQPDTF